MTRTRMTKTRVRKKKLAKILKWAGRAMLVSLAASAIAGTKIGWDKLKRSPDFKIAAIDVMGNKRVSREEILYLAGVRPGMGIFEFRMSAVVKSIEEHPWVRKAAVSRELPNRVVIRVWEEDPVAILTAEEPYYLDAELRVFKKLIPGDETNYPLLTGPGLEAVERRDSETIDALKNALMVWGMAGQSNLFPTEQIAELHVDLALGLKVITTQGPVINFGEDNWEEKFRKLERVRVEMGDRFMGLKGLDLSQQDKVVASFFKPESETGAETPGEAE